MYSLSIDYLFNRVYDFLLWIKYVWFFDLLRKNPETYLDNIKNIDYDGLRDRGWFDEYLKQKSLNASSDTTVTFWDRFLHTLNIKHDIFGNCIPNALDPSPYSVDKITPIKLKEMYQQDYSSWDKVRDAFGLPPKDSDCNGIPDSYEVSHGVSPDNLGNVSTLPDLSKETTGLHLTINNPVLHFFSQALSIFTVFVLMFFVYITMRWFSEFWKANDDYEHHFDHNSDNKKEEKKSSSVKEIELPAGIAGLAVKYDEDIILPPKEKDFDDHPRFAIIQGYISGDSEALWRIGVLEADNMLEEVLTEKGYFGNDVAEKLTNAKFNTVQLAWDAHKVRNLIAHKGSNYTLTEREAKRVFVLYEAVFRELKAIH